MEKTINISLEQAKEYYKTTNDPAFKKLLENNFGSELSDGYSWEDAASKVNPEWYINSLGEINYASFTKEGCNSNLPSESKAKSLLALAQLIVIAEAYNKDRGEDYWIKDKVTNRYFKGYLTEKGELYFSCCYVNKMGPLSFISSEDILKSFKKNKELWYDYLEVPDSQRN